MESESRVSVYARIRPPVVQEAPSRNCISNNEVSLSIPNGTEARSFTFDAVFPSVATQNDLFTQVGLPVLLGCLNGINGTILAYGQTGSGKTYSLLHQSQASQDAGLLPRVVEHLFLQAAQDPANVYKIEAAAVQVYNEQVDDLLHAKHQSGGGLALVVQNEGEIPGLTWVECERPETLLEAFTRARSNLVYAETKMNKASSRSHAIFQIKINKCGRQVDASGGRTSGRLACTRARLNIVDLAGSERVKRSCVEGVQLKEAAAINKSLHAFGNVVSALAARRPHVPFRDSKLTRVLDGSIGGNFKTALLVCVSPSVENAGESFSALEFASRAMQVDVNATVNAGVVDVNSVTMQATIAELRETANEAAQIRDAEAERRESAEQRCVGLERANELLMDTIEQEQRQTQKAMAEAAAEKEALKTCMQSQENTIADLQTVSDDSQRQLEALRAQKESVESKVAEALSRVERAETTAREQQEAHQLMLQEQESLAAAHQEEIKLVHIETQEQKMEHDAAMKQLQTDSQRLQTEAEANIAKLNAIAVETESLTSRQQEEIKRVRLEIEVQKTEHEATMTQLQTDNQCLRTEAAATSAEAEASIAKLKASALEQEQLAASQLHSETEKQNTKHEETMQQLRTESQRLKTEAKDAEAKAAAAQSDIAAIKGKLQKSEEGFETERQAVTTLQNELEALRAAMKEGSGRAQSNLAAAKETAAAAQKQVIDLTEVQEELKKQSASEGEELERSRTEAATQAKDTEQAQQVAKNAQDAQRQADQEREESVAETNRLQKELEALRAASSTAATDAAAAQTSVAELTDKLKLIQADLEKQRAQGSEELKNAEEARKTAQTSAELAKAAQEQSEELSKARSAETEANIATLKASVLEKESLTASHQEESKRARIEAEEQKTAHEATMEQLKAENQCLQTEVDSQVKKSEDAEAKAAAAQSDITDIKGKLQASEEGLNTERQAVTSLQEELEGLRAAMKDEAGRDLSNVAAAKETAAAAQKQVSDLNQRVERLQEELNQQVVSSADELERSRTEAAKQAKEIEQAYQAAAESAQHRVDSENIASAKLEQVTSELDEYRQSLQAIEAELKEMQDTHSQQLHGSTQEMELLRAKLAESTLSQQISGDLQVQHESLKANVMDMEASCQLANASAAALVSEVSAKDSHIRFLEQEMFQLKETHLEIAGDRHAQQEAKELVFRAIAQVHLKTIAKQAEASSDLELSLHNLRGVELQARQKEEAELRAQSAESALAYTQKVLGDTCQQRDHAITRARTAELELEAELESMMVELQTSADCEPEMRQEQDSEVLSDRPEVVEVTESATLDDVESDEEHESRVDQRDACSPEYSQYPTCAQTPLASDSKDEDQLRPNESQPGHELATIASESANYESEADEDSESRISFERPKFTQTPLSKLDKANKTPRAFPQATRAVSDDDYGPKPNKDALQSKPKPKPWNDNFTAPPDFFQAAFQKINEAAKEQAANEKVSNAARAKFSQTPLSKLDKANDCKEMARTLIPESQAPSDDACKAKLEHRRMVTASRPWDDSHTAPPAFFQAAFQKMQSQSQENLPERQDMEEERLYADIQRYHRAVQSLSDKCKECRHSTDGTGKAGQVTRQLARVSMIPSPIRKR